MRFLGVLLTGALIIIPAVTAKRLARKLSEMLRLSVLFAVVAALIGAAIAAWLGLETGPVIVVVAAAGFALSLLRKS